MFDLGGVLVDWNPRHLYRQLFDDEAAMEEFLATVCTPDWNEGMDRGRPFAEAVTALVAEYPDQAELIAAWHHRWPEMVAGALDETVAIAAELRAAGVPLYLLSNASAETYPNVLERFGFLGQLDGIVLSGEVGVAKPDPEIFEILCQRFGLSPAKTLFVDDVERNVVAARAVGLLGHHFQGADGLRAELVDRGLLAP